MAVAHLVCGPVASGKSTYSAVIASQANAIVLSMDKWMQTLFGADIPKSDGIAGINFSWFAERVNRCEAQMWDVAKQLLTQGDNVVLDWGFIRRERREKAATVATQLGCELQWHVVNAPADIRHARVSERNISQGETLPLRSRLPCLSLPSRCMKRPIPASFLRQSGPSRKEAGS